jgi:nucleoside-diphosphate-sugar epimerase
MQDIVITGASGFIGRHLRESLLARGDHVVAVSRRNCAGMLQVSDYAKSPSADVMIHLGEESDRVQVNQAGNAYLRSSAQVVSALANRGYRRLIYISSGTVYGDVISLPRKPCDVPVANDTYSQAKIINERIVLAAGGAVVRLSNIYGEGMSRSNVLSDIIAQIPGRGPLTVRDASTVRDYCHISDLIEALVRFVCCDYHGIINIGSGIGVSVRRLAEICLSVAGQHGRPIQSKKPGSTSFSINVLDITQTTEILNWRPRIVLVDGLTELVNKKIGLSYDV